MKTTVKCYEKYARSETCRVGFTSNSLPCPTWLDIQFQVDKDSTDYVVGQEYDVEIKPKEEKYVGYTGPNAPREINTDKYFVYDLYVFAAKTWPASKKPEATVSGEVVCIDGEEGYMRVKQAEDMFIGMELEEDELPRFRVGDKVEISVRVVK